ncbi:transcription factor bHLH68-like [Salvia splendens]|uniref:transcription factor bHLH68-like n=1 Tax=Salvia splendens TaxID=180675 RepID=UPI001C27D5E1|nr:transcription factor bHLH68-like [Salvia splendens]
MNEGILPVQQMVAAGANNWFTTNSHPLLQNHTPQPHQSPAPPPLSCPASQEFPHSWSQLVLGFAGEDDEPMEQPTTYVGNLEFRPPKSSEILMKCESGAAKKSKMNPTTSAQSGIKVRKEKLGDRITALHQLVTPFGKTDTASVLLEAIGYIRFLQRQIEALSLPYLATGSGNITQEKCEEEAKKDLKSRGLCLVPLSCTLDFGSENGADYWAPS